MTEDEFFATYRPRLNHFAGERGEPDIASCMYETYGEELAFVEAADAHHVWTLLDEDGADVIVSGQHTANRIGYLVTEVAWREHVRISCASA